MVAIVCTATAAASWAVAETEPTAVRLVLADSAAVALTCGAAVTSAVLADSGADAATESVAARDALALSEAGAVAGTASRATHEILTRLVMDQSVGRLDGFDKFQHAAVIDRVWVVMHLGEEVLPISIL